MSLLRRPGEKTYTQRSRLFVGNLPADITEDEFKRLFAKYGEPGEVFINKGKGFGLIKLESRALAKIAKAELDNTPMRGRQLLVRFATHAAALSVRNLSPYVSNELLEEAFSQFGPIERAVVIVDDRGRSTGKGIVEFASKPAARKAFQRCSEGVFLLTTTPRPVIVEPFEQLNDEDGLPEKLAQKNPMYQKERETPPRFAQHGTFEYEYSQRWKSLDEMEKQQREQVEKNMKDAKEKFESEMQDAYREHQTNYLHQGRMKYQEETRHMEEFHNQKVQKCKQMQLRQEEKRCRREEEIMIRQREMEEQMRHQREESYSQMGYMDTRERDMRMGGGGAMNMGDAHGSGSQKCPPLSGGGGGGSIGYEANPRVPPATMSGSMMGSDKSTEPFEQEEDAEMPIWVPEKAVCHHDGFNSETQTPVQKIEDHFISGGAEATAALKPQRRKRTRKRKQPLKDALNVDPPTWTQIKGLTRRAWDVIESQGATVTPALMFMTMLAIVSCQSAASLCDPSSGTPAEIYQLWLKNKEGEDTEDERAPVIS